MEYLIKELSRLVQGEHQNEMEEMEDIAYMDIEGAGIPALFQNENNQPLSDPTNIE